MTAIELEEVTFGYADSPAVHDVSLTIEEGEFVGLVGPNGSGKTTLVKLMLGLLEPDEGTVELFGRPAGEFRDGPRVGYVAQDAATIHEALPLTVREIVATGRYWHTRFGRLGEEDQRVIDRALARVGLDDLADAQVATLSGGQRQRAFIARALASEADLLALDEPTVGVDADARSTFFDLLDELSDEGMTIVMVEHDLGVVTTHVSRVLCMNCHLHYDGEAAGFVGSEGFVDAYGTDRRIVHHEEV